MSAVQCIGEGCARAARVRGRCHACYMRWYRSTDFLRRSAADPYVRYADRVCPWCGTYTPRPGLSADICPTCNLDPGEHAYIERILADFGAVYAEEHRAFQAKRRRGAA